NFKAWAAVACLFVFSIAIAAKLFTPAPIVYRASVPQVPAFIPQDPVDAPAPRPDPGKKKTTPTLIQIEAPGGMNITRLNLSPDGRAISYVAGGRIFLRRLDESQSMPVFGTEQAGTPFWSPDGTNIAFVAGRKLKKVGVANAIPTILSEI